MEVSIVILVPRRSSGGKGMPGKTCMLGIRLRHVCPCAITGDMFVLVKRRRKSKGERVIENVMKEFKEMQTESEKRFREWEEERWKREHELEERRRREDREHERLMLQMILQSQQPTYSNFSHTYQHPMYQSFNEED